MAWPPSDFVLGAHWNSDGVFALDYVRDGGSESPSASGGSPSIVSGGKFDKALEISGSGEYLLWSDSGLVDGLVQTFCLSFWYKPGYSGSPSDHQRIFSSDTGTNLNGILIAHYSNGNLGIYVRDQVATVIATILGAWSPTADTWYHFELNSDVTVGATRFFMNGNQWGGTQTGTGTRTATADTLEIGSSQGTAGANDFIIDELLAWSEVQHVSNFTPPTTEMNFLPYWPVDYLPWEMTGHSLGSHGTDRLDGGVLE